MSHVKNNSGNNEWYTPCKYVESARRVMGSIDVDPASNDVAQMTVRACQYFTKETNGLDKFWFGNVWMNPPYTSNLIKQFIRSLSANVVFGNTLQFVTLTNNATDTQWFKELYEISQAFCFVSGRIRFLDPDGNLNSSPLQGQVICYRGQFIKSFVDEFSQYGSVMMRYDYA